MVSWSALHFECGSLSSLFQRLTSSLKIVLAGMGGMKVEQPFDMGMNTFLIHTKHVQIDKQIIAFLLNLCLRSHSNETTEDYGLHIALSAC